MKKDLTIEMEEECITCPMLSLETHVMHCNREMRCLIHQCEHIDFCKRVRKNWEKYHKGKQDDE